MASADVHSKAVLLLLLLMYCLLLLPLFVRSAFGTCFVTKFHLSFCNHLVAGERAGCFTLIVFLVSCCCKCYVFLPLSAFDWSVVCDWKGFTHLLCKQGMQTVAWYSCYIQLFYNACRIEPVHEICNKMECATSKASDQPAHTRSLVRAFASRMGIL